MDISGRRAIQVLAPLLVLESALLAVSLATGRIMERDSVVLLTR